MSTHRRRPEEWDVVDRQAFLRTVPLFRKLADEALAGIAAGGRIRRIKPHRFIFLEGEQARAVNVLVEGQVKVVRETKEGHDVLIRMIHPGEIFGGAAGWGAPHYPLTAVALKEAVVLSIPASGFRRLIGDHPDVALALIHDLATRLREAETRIQELQTERVERRLARALLRLAPRTGEQVEGGIELRLPLSRQDLADLCGATLSTVSRTLSGWDRRGIISAGRERIRIRDLDRLREIAEEIRPPNPEP